LATRILQAITAPYDLDGHEVSIGASIGIVLAPEDGSSANQLLKNADLAMYRVKATGRNGFRFFEPEMESTRRALENDLRHAISLNQLELRYQTIVEAETQQVCGVEALVRWRHPRLGTILPDQFIPIAEETGLIASLGEWIVRRACADAVTWPTHIKIAINLSPVQFGKGDLRQIVSSALGDSGLAPERLELEVTESVLLKQNDDNLSTLRSLKELGVSIVLDDFGTGYSSFTYLQMFPFDKIKIDKSFVHESASNPQSAAIVGAIIGLGRSLNVATVAEGVETPEQFAMLRMAGCSHMQGFLFSQAVPMSELAFADPKARRQLGHAA
jgi:predicted signal transduction protein with EAL and GGDEF domain